MVTLKLTKREIDALELSFSMDHEPPYPDGSDIDLITAISDKLIAAKMRALRAADCRTKPAERCTDFDPDHIAQGDCRNCGADALAHRK